MGSYAIVESSITYEITPASSTTCLARAVFATILLMYHRYTPTGDSGRTDSSAHQEVRSGVRNALPVTNLPAVISGGGFVVSDITSIPQSIIQRPTSACSTSAVIPYISSRI